MERFRDRMYPIGRSLVFGISLLLPVFFGAVEIPAQPMDEYRVKAAFVLNFVRFTQWPDESFAGADAPCRLCVAGDRTLESAFRALEGKKVGARLLHVRFVRKADDCEGCNAVFVGRDIDRSSLPNIFMAVKDRPVLTIGETEEFIRRGGMIRFFVQEGRLRFEIDPKKVWQQHIKLSSRLLNLAVLSGDRYTGGMQ
ncbi:MAG: YfiR family protein [Deltaproteobacteria bacterium]|nr:YfiR family protein [Deltaproteobacteria bacterium]